jgi:hypothetical protein
VHDEARLAAGERRVVGAEPASAPPQATMNSCDGPAGSSAARRTSASIAASGRSTTFSAVQ